MTEVLLFAVGIIVGAMNAIAGGGMLIGFPVLLAVGVPALAANATSSIIVLPGQISSAYGYRKYLRRIPPQYMLLAIPIIAGAIIGSLSLRGTSPDHFERLVPALILFAVLLFAFQPFLHRQLHKHMHGPKRLRNHLKPLFIVAVAMFPVAIYGGYFGAGFGFIMLAFLGFTKLHQMHQMNALKNLMAVALATTSIICLYSSHLIDWRHGLFMAGGNLIGGYIGAVSAQKVSSHSLRIAVIAIGICTATYLAFRTY